MGSDPLQIAYLTRKGGQLEQPASPEKGPAIRSTDPVHLIGKQTPVRPASSGLPSLPGLRLQPRDVEVLGLLGEHGVATSAQLARAFWGSPATARKRLRLL